jgi:translation initiation factor 1
MSKKHKNGIVFSTDPDFKFDVEDDESVEEIAPEKQLLRIHLERLKGNKEATVIKGFEGSDDALADLAKLLKNKCAAGGSVRENGDMLVQGNHRDKVLATLLGLGFSKTKKAGG